MDNSLWGRWSRSASAFDSLSTAPPLGLHGGVLKAANGVDNRGDLTMHQRGFFRGYNFQTGSNAA